MATLLAEAEFVEVEPAARKTQGVPYTVEYHSTHSPSWHGARKRGIGGSDAASVLGLNPWRSPLAVYLEKRGEVEPRDLTNVEAVEWGLLLEDPIADKFAKNHPELKVKRSNATYVSKPWPWMLANLDRTLTDAVGRHGVLEIKTTGLYSKDTWADGVPLTYLSQVSHYLAVTGWDFVWVAVLIGGQEYREYYLGRDEDDIQVLIEREAAFWQMVQDGITPEVVGTKDEGQLLTAMHTPDDGEYIPIDTELDGYLRDYISRSDLIKEHEAAKAKATSLIKQHLGDAKGAEDDDLRVIWSRGTTSRLDAKRLEAEHPKLCAKYRTESYRDGGLRVKEKDHG